MKAPKEIASKAERYEELKKEIDTLYEELFEEVAEEIHEEMYAGCDDGTDVALSKFIDAFGADNVTFIEDGSGTTEYEAY